MTPLATISQLSANTAVLLPSLTDSYPDKQQYHNLFCAVDLTPNPTHSYHTSLSFEDVYKQDYTNKPPLSILRTARASLQDKGTLVIYDTSEKESLMESIESLLTCAGFSLANKQGNYYFLEKRPIIQRCVPYKRQQLIIKEVETPEEVEKYCNFLKYCYPTRQNYCSHIDKLFMNHSFTLLAFLEDNPDKIIGVGRYTHFLGEYDYYLPLQLATLSDHSSDEHFTLPQNMTFMGEILALSNKSRVGSQAYLVILQEIMAYQYNIAKTDLCYTTYPQRDQSIGDRAKNRFRFKQVFRNNHVVSLKYGSFADEWYLLQLDKSQIAKNHQNPELMRKKYAVKGLTA
jgi:hypothetical protein